MTRAKICGITAADDVRAAVAANAAAVGFVVDVPVDTPREVPPGRARELIEGVPPLVTSVLVTMSETAKRTADLVSSVRPDAVQVHAADPDTVAVLRSTVDVPVLAAIDANANMRRYAAIADALLVDSLDAQGAGGTGETGDWARAREAVAAVDVPVVLAGGLTPENVAGAVRAVEPFAVDVASGVEKRGGRKDHDAVRAFVERATRPSLDPIEVDP